MPNGIGTPSGGGPSIPGGGIPDIGKPPIIDRAKGEDKKETESWEAKKAKYAITGKKKDENENIDSEENKDKEP